LVRAIAASGLVLVVIVAAAAVSAGSIAWAAIPALSQP